MRFIRGDDYPQVLHIWQACFGDDESYVRFFWDECFPMCRGLGWEEDSRLVSMLFLLPGTLMFNGTGSKNATPTGAEYVYAVATLPEYRGRGYAAELTSWAAKIAQEEGKSALCLYPATEQLYAYYGKQGFVTAFRRQDSGCGRFGWPAHMLAYMHKEGEFTGRVVVQSGKPGGMLLALDGRAEEWLEQTDGRAYLEYNLE